MELIPALRLGMTARAPDVVTIVGGGGKTSLVFRLAAEVRAGGGRVVTATTTRITVRQVERAPAHLAIRSGAPLPYDAIARALDAHGHVMLVGDETLLNGKQTGVDAPSIDALAALASRLGIRAIVVEGDGSRTLPVKAPADHEPVVPLSTTHLLPVIGMDAVGAPLDETHAHRPDRIRALLGLGDDVPDGAAVRLTPEMAARLLAHPAGGAKGLPAGARLISILNKADPVAALAPARLIAARLAAQGLPALIAAAGVEERAPVIERWGPLAAVVLAAGAGRRFDGAKQAAIIDGEPMALRALRCALESGADQVLLVTGAHAAETRAALGSLPAQAGERLHLVHNAAWQSGQAGSLHAALDALDPATEAIICLPVDQPFLDPVLLRRLAAAWRAGGDLVAPLAAGELRGAPALFDRRFFADLRAVQGDRGGRAVLQAHAAEVVPVAADAAALADIDTPEDLAAVGGRA